MTPLRRVANALVRHGSSPVSLLRLHLVRYKGSDLVSELNRLGPRVSLRIRRRAGVTYRIPYFLESSGHLSYALRWFRQSVRTRSEKRLVDRLAGELVDLSQSRGEAVRRRNSFHQTALLNRAFLRLLR